jgi:hypothetical protein
MVAALRLLHEMKCGTGGERPSWFERDRHARGKWRDDAILGP